MKNISLSSRRITPLRMVIPVVLLGIFAVMAVLPLDSMLGGSYWITKLTEIMKFVILAVAWVMFSGPSGYMSLATSAFFGLGFYMSAAFSGQLPYAVLILIAAAGSFILALLVGALTLRLRGVYFCIFTFGLLLLILNLVKEVELAVSRTRGRFVVTEPTDTVYWAMLIVCAVTLLVAYILKRSRHGLALSSIGQYEEAAAHSGINVVRTKVLMFAVSAIFMGMAGAIIATRRAYVDPDVAFSLNQSFLPVLMALFGGMTYLLGPVVGAVVFALIKEELLTTWPELFMIIFGVILIVSILFLPNGIVGLVRQAWLIAKGALSVTRDFVIACAIIPVIPWLTILAYLGRVAWFKMRGQRAPARMVAEEPFRAPWLWVCTLIPGVGLGVVVWLLTRLAWLERTGGAHASS